MRFLTVIFCVALLGGCGAVYRSSSVNPVMNANEKVRVIEVTPESVMLANRSPYQPKTLPAVFSQTAGTGRGALGAGAAPDPVLDARPGPMALETRVPPTPPIEPYTIGVGDVVLLATPQVGSTVEQLSGLLAAQNSRQGYTVQDDGAIAIPSIGRVQIEGMTLEEAEAVIFQRLVENQLDPTFSLEVAEFNSRRVAVGGAVPNPTVVPVTLTPLYLDEALAVAGGIAVEDMDSASVRIYRDGTLYQIPLTTLYSDRGLLKTRLLPGDSVFVDTSYDLEMAQAYFEQQIRLAEFRQNGQAAALSALGQEVAIRRSALDEARSNYQTRDEMGAIDYDHVYLVGEVREPSRFTLPPEQYATLADALYGSGGGVPQETGDVSQIYVLRGSSDPREFSTITAWHLNAVDASNFVLATRLQLRPNDIIFVAEQPVTTWNRTIQQIIPSLVTTVAGAATN